MKIKYVKGQRTKIKSIEDFKTVWSIDNIKVVPHDERIKLAKAIWGI